MAKPDYNTQSDESLMERISLADHQAFQHLVIRHTDRFYRNAYRICQNEMQAEDVVQDAFLKIWDRPQIWKAGKGAKFTTWFYRMVVNMSIDSLRRNKNIVSNGENALALEADKGELADDGMVRDAQVKSLEGAIATLPEKQNVALNLCVYEDLSNKEAAKIMGVSVKALESLLMRAKANIRDEFIKQGIIEIKEQAHG